MNNEKTEPAKMFSHQWYDEYFRRATSSSTHAEFCEKVYGKNLCQHGLMDMEELNFLISLIKPEAKILEVGCSNGYITEYIHKHTKSEVLALDYSTIAIEQARERTKQKAKTLQFRRVDLTTEEIPGNEYDYILLIDSIYFLGDFQETIKRLSKKLNPAGKMVITFFDVQDDGECQLLGPDNTLIAKALKQLGVIFEWHDFTENVRAHGKKNYQVGEDLRERFESEGNQFLYEARAAENRFFKESAEKGALVRYMYIANAFRSA